MTSIIKNRYDLMQIIGQGSFGKVYTGIDLQTAEEVAVKIEMKTEKSIFLCNEAKIYRIIAGETGFPNIREMYCDNGMNALIIDLLGDSISSLFRKANNYFPLKTTLMLIEQMLSRLQFLHSKGIVHNDLKPSNFLVGTNDSVNILYLIDFGMASKFRGFYSNQHIQDSDKKTKFFGTPEFASINAHKGLQRSRRDDLESLAYIFLFLAKGSLPWFKNKNEMNFEDYQAYVLAQKESIPINELCKDIPLEFGEFLDKVRKLKFDEEPDYLGYKNMFRSLFIKNNFLFDDKYCWTMQRLPNLKGKIQRKTQLLVRPPTNCFTSLPNISTMKKRADKAKHFRDLPLSKRLRLRHVSSMV